MMTETPDTAKESSKSPSLSPPLSRHVQVAAWVGILAGIVFVGAVVFFSGVFIGGHFGDRCGGGFNHGGLSPVAPSMMGPYGPMDQRGMWGPFRPEQPSTPVLPNMPGAPRP